MGYCTFMREHLLTNCYFTRNQLEFRCGAAVEGRGGVAMHNQLMLYVTVYFLADAFSVCARKTNTDGIKWHRDLDNFFFFSFFYLFQESTHIKSCLNLQAESSEKIKKKPRRWKRVPEWSDCWCEPLKNSDWNWTPYTTQVHTEKTPEQFVFLTLTISYLYSSSASLTWNLH